MAEYITFQPSDHFNTKLYSGTDSSNAITGVGFQPDWVWIKRRNGVASHALQDAVRGNDKTFRSNTDGAEYTNTFFSSFDTDGFTVTSSESDVNASAGTYSSWNWKANGSGSSNSDGTITSTVSVNTTAGFSIVKYTGTGVNATVGHGLNSAPQFIIVKNTSIAVDTGVYNGIRGATKNMRLNTNEAEDTGSTIFNNTDPTSSVFSVGTATLANGSGNSHIAYCFEEKKGFSKFGQYSGNGNSNNNSTMIYTGFRPALFLWRRTDSAANWNVVDSKRAGYNVANYRFFPDLNSAEDTQARVDLLSNGIKLRTTDAGSNALGGTYIYAAFAEFPLVGSNDTPGVAR